MGFEASRLRVGMKPSAKKGVSPIALVWLCHQLQPKKIDRFCRWLNDFAGSLDRQPEVTGWLRLLAEDRQEREGDER